MWEAVVFWVLSAVCIDAERKFCELDEFEISKVGGGSGMDLTALNDHLKLALGDDPNENTLASVNELLPQGFSCLDSRADEPSLTAPGGDVGEYVLVLAILESLAKRPLVQFDADTLLVNFLASGKVHSFHMCTDGQALARLCQNTGFCWEQMDLREPPDDQKEDLLKRLSSPDYVGCDHLKSLLLHPRLYGIRREIVTMAIQSFYRVLWNNLGVPLQEESYEELSSKLDLSVFEGERQEIGMVSIEPAGECQMKTLMLTPTSQSSSVRVFHPKALQAGRATNSRIYTEEAEKLGIINGHDFSDISDRIHGLGDAVMTSLLAELSTHAFGPDSLKGYPNYKIVIPGGCCPFEFERRSERTNVKYEHQPKRADPRPHQFSCPEGSVTVQIDPECAPESNLRIDSYSIRQVAGHFQLYSGAPFEFVDANEWGVSTVDGRNSESVLGVPGSSLGEFALALALLENDGHHELDVKHILTNFALSMRAPSFSYTIDTKTMHDICTALNKCPPSNIPQEKRLDELMLLFRHPAESTKDLLIEKLKHPGFVSDPFLRFLLNDEYDGVSWITEEDKLSEDQKNLLRQLDSAISSKELKKMSDSTLGSRLGLTRADLDLLTDIFSSLKPDMPTTSKKRLLRTKSALKRCITERNGPSSDKDGIDLVKTCATVLKQLVAATIEEEEEQDTTTSNLRSSMKSMVPRVVESFFRLLWSEPEHVYQPYADGIAAKMDLVVLEGRHHERAFVKVKLASACPVNLSPLLSPSREALDSSVWVYHEVASRQYRAGVLEFLSNFLAKKEGSNEGQLMRMGSAFVDNAWRRFFQRRVADYPVYDVIFGEDCCLAGEA